MAISIITIDLRRSYSGVLRRKKQEYKAFQVAGWLRVAHVCPVCDCSLFPYSRSVGREVVCLFHKAAAQPSPRIHVPWIFLRIATRFEKDIHWFFKCRVSVR